MLRTLITEELGNQTCHLNFGNVIWSVGDPTSTPKGLKFANTIGAVVNSRSALVNTKRIQVNTKRALVNTN